jgi:nucleotide-binding universal stress UspA family protein
MNLLCATDLLPKSEAALRRSGMLAEELGACLSLLHVVAPAESARMLDQNVQRVSAQLKSRAKPPLWVDSPAPSVGVRIGRPVPRLIEVAKELGADLVILGTHRKRPLRDALDGTIAERLLRELKCPVLIVHRMPPGAYRNILLALDGSKASAAAVRAVESLVLKPGVRASVVHAYRSPSEGMSRSAGVDVRAVAKSSDAWRHDVRTALRSLLKEVSTDAARYKLILKNASTTSAIHTVVSRLNPDLLVLGTRGRGRLRRALLGSVAKRILATTGADVLIVPDGDAGESSRLRNSDRTSRDDASRGRRPGARKRAH